MYLVLSRGPAGMTLTELDDSGAMVRGPDDVVDLAAEVAIRERASASARWVWDDTSRWYPGLLRAGVRVDRCLDLRLCLCHSAQFVAHRSIRSRTERPRRVG